MDALNQIFEWFGGHWWIIFPLMGVGGAIVGRLQGLSRQHHKQKLETLRLKGEIKAAQLAARGQIAPQLSPREIAQQQANSSKELLERLFAEHDEITARWLDYELDVAKMIAFPAMSDGRQPLTAAFLRAKKIADALRPSSSDAKITEQQVTEYLDAVGNYAVAFEIAEKDARRLRDSTFTDDERKRLERAQHMLKVAVDQSATPAERQTAYRRVREELDGLIDLSDAAVENLEKKVALQLEQGRAQEPVTTDPIAAADPLASVPMPEPVADPIPVRDPLAKADPLRQTAPLRNPEH
ncbi:phage tail tape measure protein [Microbacterium azadirachtae]|uniref:Uncharacterized protein n=1 Tax=Microbacterium azadirachtae TaxID=582680 RepID=A0A0F0LM36_9MICO|nr:phage tail tape measure protein [Microbacterium azadirachtae]KJL33744.1 hypothetical protein RS86_01541 [Microbacterium azadirachtae]